MGTIIQIMRGYVHHTNVCMVGLPVVAIFGKQHKQNGRYLTISQKLRVVELSLPVHSSAGKPTDVQIVVPCPAVAAHHARVCPINPVWQLPAVHPVIDEACTLVFHV